MSRYVFTEPEQMIHWIDETAKKLLSIPRDKFGKIEVNISRTELGCTYPWIISPDDKKAWKRRFKDENVRKDS
jgi:hypothetical protein